MSAIPDDPRVRRQGDCLAAAGWEVAAFGLPGHRSADPAWPNFAISAEDGRDDSDPRQRARHDRDRRMADRTIEARRRLRKAATGALSAQAPALFGRALAGGAALALRDPAAAIWLVTRAAQVGGRRALRLARRLVATTGLLPGRKAELVDHYWALNSNFEAVYALARSWRADLWLANDWTTLPIAQRLAAEQGAPYGYDTHELAIDEYAHDLQWRLTQRPLIAAIERRGIAGAAFVSCVSEGIASRLQQEYELPERPVVIRNAPVYRRCEPRPPGGTIEVLYHGVVSPGRGLETCIRALALTRPEFRLTIRGPAADDYLAGLVACARAAGVVDRVHFDPPVPMIELVERAAAFDVGLFALPGHSEQNVHVLPNKFFEYTMAGLALCVSNLPEMSAILKKYDLGEEIDAMTPESIAAAINRLDRERIDRFKQNALRAARDLNWDAEGRKLTGLCAAALAPAGADAGGDGIEAGRDRRRS